MVTKMTGVPISPEFLLILSLLTLQLSMATPGLIPGITILFKSLGLPMSYIGLFSAYSVFIKNSAIAFCGFYRTLVFDQRPGLSCFWFF